MNNIPNNIKTTKNPIKLFATAMSLAALSIASFSIFPTSANAAENRNNPTQVNELLDDLNEFREDKNLEPVKISLDISEVSLDWSSYMADTGDFQHNPDYGNDERVPEGWNSAGEIIAMNSTGSVEQLFQQWVDSEGHNFIMSIPEHNIVGIGLATDPDGNLYGTMNFFTYPDELPEAFDEYPGGVVPVPTPEPEPAPKQSFTDVDPDNLFYEEIETLYEREITTGWKMKDGTSQFRPLTPINRDAMIVFLYRAAGSPDYTPPAISPFVDVATNNMYYKEIAWAYENGIAEGWASDAGRKFKPLEPIKRDAMAAFLMRMSGEGAPNVSEKPFKDVSQTQEHVEAITWMKENEISTGWTDGTYRPLTNTNRDAMAAFLIRWLDHMENEA